MANLRALVRDNMWGLNRTPNKRLITASDFSFLGWYRLPTNSGNFYDGSLELRRVNGNLRMFTIGNRGDGTNGPVLELEFPNSEPDPTLATAPRLVSSRYWGHIYYNGSNVDQRLGFYSPGACLTHNLYYDEARGGVWWTYGDIYGTNGYHNPCIGFSTLNDTTGAYAVYGPWRMTTRSQITRGSFTQLPSSFASAYTSGKNLAQVGGMYSGNAGCAWGASLIAYSLIDPFTTPADIVGDINDHAITNQNLILHELATPQTRPLTYAMCQWDTAGGGPGQTGLIIEPTGRWGEADAAGENDAMIGAVWIDKEDKHGLLYLAQLAGNPYGYVAPGDPQGRAHFWYGNGELNNHYCLHGQLDSYWTTTGPGAHKRYIHAFIYSPDDVALAAQGSITPHGLTPTENWQWSGSTMIDALEYNPPGVSGGFRYDETTSRLYVLYQKVDLVTNPPYRLGAVAVFGVA